MALKADVVSFAYRDFGLSDIREPTEEGLMTDCKAILKYFTEYVKGMEGEYDEVILWGKSFGGATAI